ncbi:MULTISPECIES: hypothetical protein [Protofrankia]|uniref:Uncharacterized protein n=1 Tax=Candidatus Protofrankia datiscae TaxID=2716812 RepID=F8B291_9ACTN|nr:MULTISPECIES: hypothetical protein [Protofrankia]AEH09886.1 hypothetical protein FsymDg_2519 [Candidatus Protofrankia datiscae]
MPCFRCHTRQTDPTRGASPWRRAVVAGEQVLFCPQCQQTVGWSQTLDRCGSCGSTHLAKALGLISCQDCGRETSPAPAGSDLPVRVPAPLPGSASASPVPAPPELSAEVEAALARMLGNSLR